MGRKRTLSANLPQRMYLRHGAYYFVAKAGKMTHLGRDLREAMQEYHKLAAEAGIVSAPGNIAGWAAQAAASAKNRAKRRGQPCDITGTYVRYLFEKSGGRCALTGIPFDINEGHGIHRARPWVPSIDRIDSRQGYVEGNCRLVCYAVNSAMNEYGLAVLARIARGLVSTGNIGLSNIPVDDEATESAA